MRLWPITYGFQQFLKSPVERCNDTVAQLGKVSSAQSMLASLPSSFAINFFSIHIGPPCPKILREPCIKLWGHLFPKRIKHAQNAVLNIRHHHITVITLDHWNTGPTLRSYAVDVDAIFHGNTSDCASNNTKKAPRRKPLALSFCSVSMPEC